MKAKKIIFWGLTNEKNTVKYGRIAYKPYQERWRERPYETRQPAKAWCQIRRQTTDEDSIERTSSPVCGFLLEKEKGKKLWKNGYLHLNV